MMQLDAARCVSFLWLCFVALCVCVFIVFGWACAAGEMSTVGGDCQNMIQLDAARYVLFCGCVLWLCVGRIWGVTAYPPVDQAI